MAVDVREMIEQARDSVTGRRVYSEPYEHDGVSVILAARVQGGGGGGAGEDRREADRPQTGWGSGFGLTARPVGAFVVRGDEVRWIPAVDVTRIALGGQLVALAALLTVRSIVRARAKRRR